MISSDHVEAAAARIAELSTLAGYPEFSGEWFEIMATEAGLEPLALQAFAIENAPHGQAPASVKGLLTGVLATHYATQGVAG